MEVQVTKTAKLFLALIAIVGWFAIIVQFFLMMENRVASLPETITRFFSFFTILTNLLVAICATTLVVGARTKWMHFLSKITTVTAIVVYITIVGLVYNVILRFLWAPQGLQRIVDEMLHTIVPTLSILSWFIFVDATSIKWKNFFSWLIYPMAYLLFILCRGPFGNFYPYPFVDVAELGLGKVLINSLALTFVFAAFSLLFIGIGRIKNKKRN